MKEKKPKRETRKARDDRKKKSDSPKGRVKKNKKRN